MNLNDFVASLAEPQPPSGLSPIAEALWHDARGDWEQAHNIAQSHEGTRTYDRLHAYLHRKEGDDWNAGYWYRRAKTEIFQGTLQAEWEVLVQEELG